MTARLLARLVACVALVMFAIAAPRVARAQAPELRTSADTDIIGLGDSMHVTLQATSTSGTPVDPQLGATGGLVVTGISPSTSTQMTIMNGAMSTHRVLTTIWTLRAQKVGTSVVGPFTVTVDGTRYRVAALHVRVVPTGQAPARPQQRQPQNPFSIDPFQGLLQQFGQIPGFDIQEPQRPREGPQVDPKLALDGPRAPVAFLHAVTDKETAFVGEQVTYTVLLYVDDASLSRDPDFGDLHEAPASQFVRRSLQLDDSQATTVGLANVGGRVWEVKLLRKQALFPLATGDLSIGEMKVQVLAPGAGPRASEDLHVRVSEPPMAGRPPGYAVGNVGAFTLSSEVNGHEIDQDGAVGVDVSLTGTGNLPAALTPPERPGVEWLVPAIHEKLGPQGDRWGGTRTFQYVVRVHRAGDVELGDFTLPYWDPQAKRYDVARVPLGSVHVKPGAAPSAGAEAAVDPLPGLPALRPALEGAVAARASRHLADAPAFWLGLGGMPLAYVVAVAASGAARRVREKRAARGTSPAEELRARVKAAEHASTGGDARALDAATIRALEAAVIAGCGVNVRGLATSAVAEKLIAEGVKEETARELEAVLRACEAARFSATTGGGDDGEARERWQRARGVLAHLGGAT